ncbi:MAG: hypothetical protein B6I20_01815 [Bacteroidetes bacterium 4572_117]|nr:MAG: hypothetical protein B6I20_01815 [Bacteroidetes bacterium 4572_117]
MGTNKIISNLAFFIIASLLFLFSCNTDSSGYKTTENGLKFQYLKENIQGKHPKTGDYVEIKLIYANNTDSVLFNSEEIGSTIKMKLDKASHKACFEEALLMLKTGEKALFKISADSFFLKTKKTQVPNWVKPGEMLFFDIELINILNKKQVEKEQQIYIERRKKEEDEIIQQYIDEFDIKEDASMSGLYYIEYKEGTKIQAKPGDLLQVHYTGRFIDGAIFDSSIDRNELFVFKLGNAEVIAGWEEGFSKMKEGGKARFIIPSHLAYGEKGYGEIIPPFSTLIFDVELVKIKEGGLN